MLENISTLLRVGVEVGNADGGGVFRETVCLRAMAWCDFFVCDRARAGIIGASASLEALDCRGEARLAKGRPGDRKKLERWFSSTGLGEHSIDELSGVVPREEASDPRELSESSP